MGVPVPLVALGEQPARKKSPIPKVGRMGIKGNAERMVNLQVMMGESISEHSECQKKRRNMWGNPTLKGLDSQVKESGEEPFEESPVAQSPLTKVCYPYFWCSWCLATREKRPSSV
jgi:hypothetical protein